MPYIRANNCDLYVENTGQGRPIVFLHGQTHNIDLFPDQITEFSRDYRCVAYERRGHGRSQVAPYGYSVWNQAHDLKGLLDELGLDRVVLVAVAMSTTIAVTFANEFSDRIAGLVLCSWYELDGYPRLEDRRKKHLLSFADLHMKMLDIMQKDGRQGLERYLQENYETLLPIFPADKPDVTRKLVEIFACHPPSHYWQTGEFYTSIPHLIPKLREVKCPVLGICGDQDPSPDQPENLGDMPNFSQSWIKDARRFTMMECPREFNDVLREFLDRIGY
jgi:pimeloyl-ACP methyl ester carboxylesterase